MYILFYMQIQIPKRNLNFSSINANVKLTQKKLLKGSHLLIIDQHLHTSQSETTDILLELKNNKPD